ncbi:MAG: DUF58 domain-containing protein [Chloroflexota bacterium]
MNTRKIIIVSVPLLLLALGLLISSMLLLRLALLVVLVITFSYLWVRFGPRRLGAHIALPPEHLQAGDCFQRKVVITNADKLPFLWLILQDNTDLLEHQDKMVNIPGRSSYSWNADFSCHKRGSYHLGPVTLTATDPFGIFTYQRTLGETQEIIVYPATIDLPHLKFSSFRDFGNGSGYQSVSHLSPNASGVREFASGDSLHHIHWPSTARIGKLMVKMFDTDRSFNASRTVWILLDMNKESHFDRDGDASEEYAVTVAASVAQKCVQKGMKVGMIASGESCSPVMPRGGEEHLWQLLQTTALMKTEAKVRLSETASRHADIFRHNPLAVMVATSATPNLMETIHRLRNRVGAILVVLLDIRSWGGRPLSTDMVRALTLCGAQVYTVRKGDDLAKVLDSQIHAHLLSV